MPYLTREDGERFVIPSYRDTLSVKKSSVLKKEILLLSENYGGFAALQKKNIRQYEIALSTDPGYLLGESVWHYFKRPFDMVFCEMIPNTMEAILVVVKSGSVHLDGTYSIDSIQDELVTFLTQKNNFDIYIYGDVPISKTPEPGKFSFDPSQVKSFNVLSEPVFPRLPKIKAFQLQLVDTVLRRYGIGVFPITQVFAILVMLGLAWMGWSYLTSQKKELPTVVVKPINPYQDYINALTTPAPADEISGLSDEFIRVTAMPGWVPSSIYYSSGALKIDVKSLGTNANVLKGWAKNSNYKMEVGAQGFNLTKSFSFNNRLPPKEIGRIDDVLSNIVDNVTSILPGNSVIIGTIENVGSYKEARVAINFSNISAATIDLIGKRLSNMPLVLIDVKINFALGMSGTISLLALGN